MKIAVFGARDYDRHSLNVANAQFGHDLIYLKPHLSHETCSLAEQIPAVCAFVNDTLDRSVLTRLAQGGTTLVALRCAGFNNVDLPAAAEVGVRVVRVPSYSPYAIAEHTVGMMLSLNRKIHRAYNRVREGNFALDGLLGFDMHGRTVGLIGAGQIGTIVARILRGFGCNLLVHDKQESGECLSLEVEYVDLDRLLAESDIISLHCPLTPQTTRLINAEALAKVKPGVMLINTSRGAVVDTRAAIEALKSGRIGYLGLDVYEEEAGVFFEDGSDEAVRDDMLARLLTFPNVLITGHQAFFTREALANIAETTLANIAAIEKGEVCRNEVKESLAKA
jgi:D-lactate dehydrogenase